MEIAFGMKLTTEGIEQLLSSNAPETLHWEFKRFLGSGGKPEIKDRERLAELVSGFANSSGGVLLWGAVAAKDSNGAEFLKDLEPIMAYRELAQNLDALLHNVVDPVPSGVINIPIEFPRGSNTGIIASVVPPYDGLPVMARANNQQYCYFVRNGTSFNKMEAFQLADRFGRRPQPNLRSTIDIRNAYYKASPGDPKLSEGAIGINLVLEIFVVNAGRGIARDVMIKVIAAGNHNGVLQEEKLDSFFFEGTIRRNIPIYNADQFSEIFYPGTRHVYRTAMITVHPDFMQKNMPLELQIVTFADNWYGSETLILQGGELEQRIRGFADKHYNNNMRD